MASMLGARAPRSVDLLITGGTVVTVDPARRVLAPGAVAIEAGRIVAVGPADEVGSAVEPHQRLDATGKVVFPGLVNTHTHLFQTLLKGLGDDRVLVDWFRQMTGPSAAALTEEDCYHAALAGCLEALRSGTTTITDFMYVHPRPGLSDAVIRAMEEIGIRGVFARGYCDTGIEEGVPPPLVQDLDTILADCERVARQYDGAAGGRIRVRFAPCMIWTVTAESLRAIRALATQLSVGLTMHVAETPFELDNSRRRFGVKDLELLEQLDFLGPDVLAVHCVYLDERDLRILKARQVCVSHNPTSNMYLSSGVAPIPAMLMAGIAVGLASDGPASNNTHNMIQAMKLAALLHKVATRDPTIITAERVLELATIDGARALGLEAEVGSLEPGKRADLMIVDLAHSPYAAPVHHPVSALVYSAIGSEVETVVVDGRLVVREGRATTVDEARVLRAAQAAADGLVERAGTARLRRRPWRSIAF
jgi:5-methylthioadenosine/S-adenosylhomocysteine deaminase